MTSGYNPLPTHPHSYTSVFEIRKLERMVRQVSRRTWPPTVLSLLHAPTVPGRVDKCVSMDRLYVTKRVLVSEANYAPTDRVRSVTFQCAWGPGNAGQQGGIREGGRDRGSIASQRSMLRLGCVSF